VSPRKHPIVVPSWNDLETDLAAQKADGMKMKISHGYPLAALFQFRNEIEEYY